MNRHFDEENFNSIFGVPDPNDEIYQQIEETYEVLYDASNINRQDENPTILDITNQEDYDINTNGTENNNVQENYMQNFNPNRQNEIYENINRTTEVLYEEGRNKGRNEERLHFLDPTYQEEYYEIEAAETDYNNIQENHTEIIHMKTPFCNDCSFTWECRQCSSVNDVGKKRCHYCNSYNKRPTRVYHYVEERVSCQACFEVFNGRSGMIINFCFHRFCLSCIKEAIFRSVDLEIKCPYTNGTFTCDNSITLLQIQLFNNPVLNDICTARKIEIEPEIPKSVYPCATSDCEGFIMFDDTMTSFLCKECGKKNCLICRAIHENRTCDDYQEYIINKLLIPKDSWKCQNCTLINKLTLYECETCHTKNPAYTPDYKHYNDLIQLNDQLVIYNDKEFECPICFVEYQPKEGVKLKDCFHVVCVECLKSTVRYSDTPVVKCPYMDQNFSCNGVISEHEIKKVVDQPIYDEYLMKSITMAEAITKNAFHCKTPDCMWWCEYEMEVNDATCPICQKKNCFNCQAIHENKTCKEYQDDETTKKGIESSEKMLAELVEKGEAMKCPKCNITIMKRDGCDFIICTMCKTQICWVTKGPRWGPGGQGDHSGGCRCNVNGKKCHPNCRNCH